MAKKQVTQEYLERKVWWWRPGVEHPNDFGPNYESITIWCERRIAFHYELLRRVSRSRRLAPFTSLNYGHLRIISNLTDEKLALPIVRPATLPQHPNELGWTPSSAQWNLGCSDRSWVLAFKDFIHQERARQQIPRPVPNKGKRNRGFSWRWPELMDVADLTSNILDDNERSSLSMARRLAKEKLKQFDKAIDEHWKTAETNDSLSSLADDEEADEELVDWIPSFPPVIHPCPLWKNIWPKE